MLPGDERAHFGSCVSTRADLDLRESGRDGLDERIGDIADGNDDGDRHAALARGAVCSAYRRISCHVDIGIREDDHVVLRAAERLNALAVRGSGGVDVARDRSRADETHCGDVRMLEQAVDGDLVTLNDVEHACGEPGLGEKLGHEEGDRRVLLAGLEDEAVARGDRVGEHPHRDHGREVERRDAGDHAEGLLDRVHVDPAGDLLAVAALEERRDTACEFDVLNAAGELTSCIARHLAMLDRDELGDLCAVLVDELAELEHDLGALGERGEAPGGKGLLGIGDGPVDLGDRGETDLGLHLAGGGIVDRAGAAGGGRDECPVDPVIDRAQGLLRSSLMRADGYRLPVW